MTITVERLPNEPILVATFSGNITVEDFKSLYEQSTALIGNEPGTFHRITDVRDATANFSEMLKATQAARGVTSSAMDERIQVIFVGTNKWITFARDIFAKRGITMAAFEEMDTALESVRWQIAHEKTMHPLDESQV